MHPLLLLLSSFVAVLACSSAADSLTQGQSLKDGQTLISAGQVFELGFFSPGNSPQRYVGIWYYNMSQLTVVWVANRENPLMDSAGSLILAANGNLQLMNGSGAILWSTNILAKLNASTAKLNDDGDLLLQSEDGTLLWQSFDHPSDTFVPGMRLSLDLKTRENKLLTSWKSPDDPAPGNYTLGLDPTGSAQIFIWEGSVRRWRSGQWNRQTFVGTMMPSLNIYGFNLQVGGGKMELTFTPASSPLLRFVLQDNGAENTSRLVRDTKQWQSVWVQPVTECELYGKCGLYGMCSNSSSPICSCLEGFEPVNSDEWSNRNWSGGCVRRTSLACELNSNISDNNSSSSSSRNSRGIGDGFFPMKGVKLPDFSEWASAVGDAAGCVEYCIGNCSCKAYSYVESIGCLVWVQDLIDIYQFPDGGGYDLNIKLALSEPRHRSMIWVTAVIPSVVGVALLMLCVYFWWKYNATLKGWCKKDEKQETMFSSMRFSGDAKLELSGPSEPGEGQDGERVQLSNFALDVIVDATDNFSDSNKLGGGGFGHVYKGILPGGEVVAIKRLSRSSRQGMDEFKNEVSLIAKLQHRNLVRLLGCCIQGEEKMLIYEYMHNKSLDVFLFDPAKQGMLDWNKRFNIIEGIARGLLYLHRDSRLRIIHRDLKASNVLLDEDMNPKISDFGMARIFGGDQSEANTNRLVGTYGYMSPEYAMEGLFSVKSDVYSFGVLILEIVTGRKNRSFHHFENSPNIMGYAWPMWNEGRAVELIDPSIRNTCSVRQTMRCVHVGLLCVQDRPNDRPDMSSVVLMLDSKSAILQMPRQPTFVSEIVSTGDAKALSANDVTITILSPR